MKLLALPLGLLAASIAAVVAAWWWLGRPVAMPAGMAGDGGRLQCVSYAPFRADQNPLELGTYVKAEQIDREPVVFLPAVALAALPAYDPQAQFAEEVDQVQGPFGVRIGELRLGVDATAGLEIAVEGFAGELPHF